MLQRLGLAELIQAKTKRYIGTDMIEPLIHGKGKEIGFMPVVQILNYRGRGLQLVGPLPAELQSPDLVYVAGAPYVSEQPMPAKALIDFLADPKAAAVYKAKGFQPG